MKLSFYFKFLFLILLMLMAVGIGAMAEDSWVATAPADLAGGDIVVIVDVTSERAMTNNNGTQNPPTAKSVKINTNKTELTGTIDETIQWTVERPDGNYQFHVGNSYLYCNNSNDGVRVGSNSNNIFTIKSNIGDNSADFLYNSQTGRYLGVYNSQDWRCYLTADSNNKNTVTLFFKKMVVTSISLSGTYPTAFYVDDVFSHEGIVVTASFDDNSTTDVTHNASFSVPDMSSIGTKTVTVNYGGQSAEYTIAVNEKPSYNISFSVNGSVSEPVEYVRGETIQFPEITPLEGYTFMGWAKTEIPVQQTDAPELVNISTAKAFDNTTYYAVYAVKSGETVVSYEDVLTREVTGITGSSYSSFSGKKVTSDAVYAGICAGGNSSIQLRSANNNSGIVSTTSGGKVKKVQVIWNSNTASGRTLEIYGSNTAYSSASDLYVDSKSGEKLGSIVCGTSTELIIDGDFAYIGMRSSSGAMYLAKIIIAWDSNVSTYSNYCTLVSVPTVDVSVSNVGYSTLYYGDCALKVPAGVTATTYSVNGNTLTESIVYEAGTVIPAGEAVVIKALAGTYTFAVSTASVTKDEDNKLRGSDNAEETTGGTLYYALTLNKQNDPKSVGFYWMNETGTAFTNGAHKAYLALDGSLGGGAQAKSSYLFSEVTTDINSTETVANDALQEGYNLNGQRVNQGYRGIVIVNGRKYIAK